jgi:hypothetical protein
MSGSSTHIVRQLPPIGITSQVIAGMTCEADAWDIKEADMTLTARTTLLIDAAATTATAVMMLAAREVLYPYFGLTTPQVLDVTAVAFLIYAAVIALVARRPSIERSAMMTVVAANIAYVVASMALLVMFWSELHAVGCILIVAVALAVEAFAAMQFLAVRRGREWSPVGEVVQ